MEQRDDKTASDQARDEDRSFTLRRVLARGASGLFAVRVIGQGLILAVMVLLARVLGPEDFGAYVYVLAWLNLGVLAASLGFDTTLLRHVAGYAAAQRWGLLRGLLRRGNQLVLLVSMVGAGAIAFVLLAFSPSKVGWTGVWACAVVPLLALSALRAAALQGLQRPVLASIPELIVRPVGLGLLLGAAILVFERGVDAPDAMQLYLLAVLASYLLGARWLSVNLPVEVRRATPEYASREWVGTALSLLLVSGSFQVIVQTDTVMVGLLATEIDAGRYYASSRLSQLVQFGMVATQGIAAPMISRAYARGEHDVLQRILTLAAIGSTGFAFLFMTGFVFFGEAALGLFGEGYTTAYPTLLLLSLSQVANAFTGLTGLCMSMTGRHAVAAVIVGVAALLNIGLNATLIPLMGTEGAALSTCVTTILWNGVAAAYLWRSMGLVTLALPGAGRAR